MVSRCHNYSVVKNAQFKVGISVITAVALPLAFIILYFTINMTDGYNNDDLYWKWLSPTTRERLHVYTEAPRRRSIIQPLLKVQLHHTG